MQTKVTLLDGSLFTCTVEVRQLETGKTCGTGENMIKYELCPVLCRNGLVVFSCLRKFVTMSTCWRETTSLCASEMPTTTRYLSVCLFNFLSLCLSVCLSDPTFCLVELAGSSEGDEEAGQRSVALSLPPGGGGLILIGQFW